MRYVYEHMREFMKPRWKRACRFLRRWDAAPPLVKKKAGLRARIDVVVAVRRAAVIEMRVLLAGRRGARVSGDLAWLLGLLGFGALMERARARRHAVVRRFAAAAFEKGVVGSS